MNILKTFSPLLKEPKLLDDLPVVLRVRKFDEAAKKINIKMKSINDYKDLLISQLL